MKLNTAPRITLAIMMPAPLASHFNCWRRSPDERRQLSTWRTMKPSASATISRSAGRWTSANQPPGLSVADTAQAERNRGFTTPGGAETAVSLRCHCHCYRRRC